MRSSILRFAPDALAAAFGIGWYVALGGARTLLPGNLDWLGRGDRGSELVAWLLFRNESWHLPLGRIDGLLYPVGSSVALADAIPLAALPARLVSPLLPEDFQYMGLWLALCFALQGFSGARLAAAWTNSAGARLLSGMLLVLAPPLTARVVDGRMLHGSLTAQWLVVAALGLALSPASRDPARPGAARAMAGLVMLATFVHPVLSVMTLAIGLSLLARWAIEGAPMRRLWGSAAVLLFAVAAPMALLGYFGAPDGSERGFGFFSADLLSLVNPMWMSRLLPALLMGEGQYEGFGYLGLGAASLILIAGTLLATVRPRLSRRRLLSLLPLVAASIVMAVFALSSGVTVAGKSIADLRGFYSHFQGLAGTFRSSGRFVWPLHYVLVASAVVALLRAGVGRPRAVVATLAAVVALQLADLSAVWARPRFQEQAWRLPSPEWMLAKGHYGHLALAPPQIPTAPDVCNGPYAWDYSLPLGYEAYRLGATVNSGFVARLDGRRTERGCRDLLGDIVQGQLRRDTIYVLHPIALRASIAQNAVCGALDGRLVCVSKEAHDPFRVFLESVQHAPAARSR